MSLVSRPADAGPLDLDLDLNCDLGEGEGPEQTAALMAQIDSANIACGGHAGGAASMRRCLELALRERVQPGAHPGAVAGRDSGRQLDRAPGPDELRRLLRNQVGALQAIASELRPGWRLHHVKLHGALYHATDADPELARAYVEEVADSWPGLILVARVGGRVAQVARSSGVPLWEEAFLDRAYADDGTLVPRGQPGAVLDDTGLILDRLEDLQTRGGWRSVNGAWLAFRPRTLCLHGDTPRAAMLLATVRQALGPRRTARS